MAIIGTYRKPMEVGNDSEKKTYRNESNNGVRKSHDGLGWETVVWGTMSIFLSVCEFHIRDINCRCICPSKIFESLILVTSFHVADIMNSFRNC